uniref:uncharacterized protein LOC122593076 n=1 Tax=Erigeron canadensis TaxID=72917 RepID=UPI001CB981C0|nr:uncharacterized protein LOC122593076 [Erigeron canadensis]
MGDKVHDVDVDMSHFKGKFKRYVVNWVGKGVESVVGELHVGEEVLGIDFDEYDSGVGSGDDEVIRKLKIRNLKVEHNSTTLQDLLQQKVQISISKTAVYRAKEKAQKKIRGNFHEQYSLLRDYIMELKQKNPNTTVKLAFSYRSVNPASTTRVFQRIYVCLGSLNQGFKELGREIIGLDGAFMKGPYLGQLLTAVSMDGNNWIYPVAYALVESECRNSWEWLLQCLGDDLELPHNVNFTFIYDRQKGILQAVNSLFPSAEHRFCLKHIHENLKTRFRGCGFRDHFWFAATRTTVVEFKRAMDEIRQQDTIVYEWLRAIPVTIWSRAHFSGRTKCDILLNNICESFNSKFVKGREIPIISCLEFVREYIMRMIVVVQGVIDVCTGPLTPTATQILKVNKEAAEKKWELTDIPCKHAVAAMNNMHKYEFDVGIPEDWVHTAYTLETWNQVYSNKIEPIVGATY